MSHDEPRPRARPNAGGFRTDGGRDGSEPGTGGRPESLPDDPAARRDWAALDGVRTPAVEYAFVDDVPVVRRVNDAFLGKFGRSGGDVEGGSLEDVLAGPYGAAFPELEPTHFEGTVARQTTDGRRKYRLTVVPLEREVGPRQIATYRDPLTIQREYQRKVEALHQSTRRLVECDDKAAIAETAVDPAVDILGLPATSVHFVDDDHETLPVVATTDATEEAIGEPPALPVEDSLAGRVYDTGDPIAYENPAEYPGVYNPDTPLRSEVIVPLGDHGVLISAATEANAFSDADTAVMTILAANTTAALDRVEREVTLAGRERELARQNERLETFANMITHDLRNPLEVARLNLDMARTGADDTHLRSVAEAHERMEQLVQDLLTMARHGGDLDEVASVSIREVATDAWTQVDTRAATLEVEDDLDAVTADRSRLAACFENLFRNAVEHGAQGERPGVDDEAGNRDRRDHDDEAGVRTSDDGPRTDPATTPTIRVGPTDGGFFVEDDGPGVQPEKRDDVFEAGYSTSKSGTGMGLAIVRDVVETHDWGVALAESASGGVRFEFDATGPD